MTFSLSSVHDLTDVVHRSRWRGHRPRVEFGDLLRCQSMSKELTPDGRSGDQRHGAIRLSNMIHW
jgi:hypothetical protein